MASKGIETLNGALDVPPTRRNPKPTMRCCTTGIEVSTIHGRRMPNLMRYIHCGPKIDIFPNKIKE
jgi:hypothetical protein